MLTAATFIVVTSEMLPIGLLTPVSDDLGVTTGTVGLSVTITGVTAAVAAPIIVRHNRFDRRTAMLMLMGLLAAGNATAAAAWSFDAMIIARVLVGIGMGGVWAFAASLAPTLVAPRRAATATATVFSGVALASVLGVPAGTYLGALVGWRTVFGAAGLIALAVLVGLSLSLPKLPVTPEETVASIRTLAANRALRIALIVVALLVTGHFAAYTYVRPALEQIAGLDADRIGGALLAYGLAGMAGNFIAGWCAARRPRATVISIGVAVAASVSVVPALGGSVWLAIGLIATWGIAYGGVSVATMTWATAAAPNERESVSGLFVAVFNAAIASGALVGGVVNDQLGVSAALWVGATLVVLAVGVAIASSKPKRVG